VDHYELEYKRSADAIWKGVNVSRSAREYLILQLVVDTAYDVRVRTVNAIGGASDWVTGSATVAVKDQPPGAPSGLAAANAVQAIHYSWALPADPDVAVIELWASASNDRTSAVRVWSGYALQAYVPLASGQYYAWGRAIDTSGNQSAWHPSAPNGGVVGTAVDLQLSEANFPEGLEPVKLVTALPNPATWAGSKVVFLTTDGKLYRLFEGQWTTAVTHEDLAANSVTAGKIAAGAISADKIQANTITAGKIQSESLGGVGQSFNAGLSVSIPGDNTRTEVLAWNYTAVQAEESVVNLVLAFGLACPLATTGIWLEVVGVQDFVVYNKSSQPIECRSYSGTVLIKATVPVGGQFSFVLSIRQNSGSTFNAEDPYILCHEMYA
jgi:hypothetical protein